MGSGVRSALIGAVLVLSAASCGQASEASVSALERSPDAEVPPSALAAEPEPVTGTAPPSTTTAPPPPSTAPPVTDAVVAPVTAAPPSPPPIERVVMETGFAPYASAEGLTLHHPASAVERIGFHQSGHDGARQQEVDARATRAFVMQGRDRGTGDRTAADIVVEPDREIRSPVTGTVIRASGYTLYCDHRDEYLVIDPDGRPGWEVKVLHVEGLQVATGGRVEAGVTVVALRGRALPFDSQVDEFTAAPAWPHVHIEVVDPTIPDRPSPGGGCS